jgi:hypothetical protein
MMEINPNMIRTAEARNPDAVRMGPNTMVIFESCAYIQ